MVKAKVSNQVTRVTAGSYNRETTVTSTNNPSQYWANVSEAWAKKMDGMVANEDYSAKYYAAKAKEEHDFVLQNVAIVENIAETSVENINTIRTEAVKDIESAVSSIDTKISAGVEELNTTITEGLENINTSVTSGVETIETLQANSIAEITTNKESALSDITTASNLGLDNIATAETNALNNIDTDLTNATNEINTNRANTLAQISTLANTSISDINAVGKSYDNLTYRNITNCLLEVPQRIKYTLENGTLTIKAGSVVIVPYGTEDLTSQYPVGATFINENFKVVDTQFADGKFFVWAELVSALSNSLVISVADNITRTAIVDLSSNTLTTKIECVSGDTPVGSGNSNYILAYNTTTNLLGSSSGNTTISYTSTVSLPVLTANPRGTTNAFNSITQVFNGFGYIGSTIWADKGVKGLIPNGRNEDGTLNNVELETTTLKTFGYTGSTGQWLFGLNENGYEISCPKAYYYEQNSQPKAIEQTQIWYKPIENKFYCSRWDNTTNFEPKDICIVASKTYDSNTNITSFNPKQPFRAADYNDIDGQLVVSYNKILGSTSIAYNGSITCDLSNYLPNDGNVYEVDCSLWATSGTTNGSGFNVSIISDYIGSFHGMAYNVNRTEGKTAYGSGTCKIPVGGGRYIKIMNNISSGAGTSKVDMQLHSYRKVR